MYKTVLTWAAKVLLPLAALAAAVLFGYTYGQNDKQVELQPGINKLNQEVATLKSDKLFLEGRIQGMLDTKDMLDDVRKELKDATRSQRDAMDKMIASLLRRLPKTGDECVDAKAVAQQYFLQLRAGKEGAK